MHMLLQIGLSNAVAAAVLAVLALVAGYFCRRPALVHGLWLLVLLKLVTPPVVWLPLFPTPTPEPAPAVEPAAPLPPIDPAEAERILQTLPPVTVEPAPEPALLEQPEDVPAVPFAWQSWALAVWLGGSLLWLVVTAIRIQCFRRLLGQARLAPNDLRQQVQSLAGQLRLKHCPEVWLVPGPLSPMLFALAGRPRLLLPAGLWSRLADEQRQTLLIHELAHYRRRDHWVRLLELVATGLYWWHPVVWWARHELRAAEEECCDAWVVWALPNAARAYATALMETVDFLAEARPLCPPAASGIGHLHALKRRLTMIMRGTTPRALSWTGLLAVLGLGLLLLPWLPTWAQEPPRDDVDASRPAGPQPVKRADFHKVFDAKSENCIACHHAGTAHPGAGTMHLHDEMVRLLGQVERDRQHVLSAENELQVARQHLQANEQRLQTVLDHFRQTMASSPPRRVVPSLNRSWADALFSKRDFDAGKVAHGSPIQFTFRMSNDTGREVHIDSVRSTCGCAGVRVSKYDLKPGEQATLVVRVDTRRFVGEKSMNIFVMFDKPHQAEATLSIRIDSVKKLVFGQSDTTKRPAAGEERQRRLQEMQKQLDELRKEVESLRRQPAAAPAQLPAPATGQPRYTPYQLVPPGNPVPPPATGQQPNPLFTPYRAVPPGTSTVPADPFKDKYYAPTVPLRPEDPNHATASKLWKLGETFERGDQPGQARYYFELLQKRYPASPQAARAHAKLQTLLAKPADK